MPDISLAELEVVQEVLIRAFLIADNTDGDIISNHMLFLDKVKEDLTTGKESIIEITTP